MIEQSSQVMPVHPALLINPEIANAASPLHDMVNTIPCMVYQVVVDSDGVTRFTFVSESTADFLGFSPEELINDYSVFVDRVDSYDQERVAEEVKVGIQSKKPFFIDFKYKLPSNEIRFLRNYLTTVSTSKDEHIINNGVIVDITQREKMTDELLESKRQLRRITDAIPGIVYQLKGAPNGDMQMVFVNEYAKQAYDRDFDDVKDALKEMIDAMHPEDAVRVTEENRRCNQAEIPLTIEYRIINKEGEIKWLRSSSQPSHVDDYGNKFRNGIIIDITNEKRSELKIKNQVKTISLIQKITSTANQAENPKDIMFDVLKTICAYSNHDLGHALFTKSPDEQDVLITSGLWVTDYPERFAEVRKVTEGIEFGLGVSLPGHILREKKTSWIGAESVNATHLRAKAGLAAGVKSGFGMPIMVGERVVAVLEFYTLYKFEYSDDYLDLMDQIGVQLGRMFERKQAEDERHKLGDQLASASRLAGMAEVASGVLHNVGNVLNSLNVSAGIVTDTVRGSNVGKLKNVVDLLNENIDNLSEFLTESDKGKKLLSYLNSLSDKLLSEQKIASEELSAITDNVEHIKAIVQQQQSYAKNTQLLVQESINALVESALEMNASAMRRHNINIIRDFEDIPVCMLDKHNILQVLGNLISNAKQAMEYMQASERRLILTTRLLDKKTIRVEVQDNGSGITEENMKNLFEYGFTTKEEGNGFGLHASANTAIEMGGVLECQSDGKGQGATFIFELPFKQE